MTASEYIKSHGLPSLAHVAKMVGRHPDTVCNWYKDSFPLFEIVVAGCMSRQEPTYSDVKVRYYAAKRREE